MDNPAVYTPPHELTAERVLRLAPNPTRYRAMLRRVVWFFGFGGTAELLGLSRDRELRVILLNEEWKPNRVRMLAHWRRVHGSVFPLGLPPEPPADWYPL